MTRREKTLAAAVAAAGVLWFGNQQLDKYRTAIDRNSNQQLAAEEALNEANVTLARGLRARKKLRKWVAQSLPTDQRVAKSLYQDWLRAQLTGAGLEVTQVADKSGNRSNPQFGQLSVDVKAKGTLPQLADFLYRFYSAVHLHRISAATLTPSDGGAKLDVSLTVGALMLPECKRTDKLAEGEPRAMPAPLEEISKRVTSRNLFTAYKSKAGGQGAEAPDADAAAAKITSIFSDGDSGWQLSVKAKDKVTYYRLGDSIEIGRVKGTLLEIDGRRVVLKTEKGRLELRLGQTFAEGTLVETPAA